MKRLALPVLLIAMCSPAALYARGNRAAVVSVTDGDTIRVSYRGKNRPVRLIGIDAPESRRNRKARRDSSRGGSDMGTMVAQGKLAKKHVQGLVKKGDTVRLVFDVEKRDRYRRLLAYVYLSDGRMLNDVIIRDGYASPLTIPPNVKHRKRFLNSYRYARRHGLGLWGG